MGKNFESAGTVGLGTSVAGVRTHVESGRIEGLPDGSAQPSIRDQRVIMRFVAESEARPYYMTGSEKEDDKNFYNPQLNCYAHRGIQFMRTVKLEKYPKDWAAFLPASQDGNLTLYCQKDFMNADCPPPPTRFELDRQKERSGSLRQGQAFNGTGRKARSIGGIAADSVSFHVQPVSVDSAR